MKDFKIIDINSHLRIHIKNVTEDISVLRTSKFNTSKYNVLEEAFANLCSCCKVGKETVFVEIPRAGGLTTNSITRSLCINDIIVANTGRRKIEDKPVLPWYTPSADEYVLGDIFIVTGSTISEVISSISKIRQGEETKIIVFCVGLSFKMLKNSSNLAKLARKNNMHVDIYTCTIETKIKTVHLNGTKQTILGKVYKNKSGKIIGYELGDYGDFYDDLVKEKVIRKHGPSILNISKIIFNKIVLK